MTLLLSVTYATHAHAEPVNLQCLIDFNEVIIKRLSVKLDFGEHRIILLTLKSQKWLLRSHSGELSLSLLFIKTQKSLTDRQQNLK